VRRGGWDISSAVASDALARMEERMESRAEDADWLSALFGSTARPLWNELKTKTYIEMEYI